MTGKPDIEGLERFSRRVSRRLTEFFAGRKHEIDFITKRVEEVARMHREGTPATGEVRDGAGMKLAPAPEPDDGPSFGM